MLLAMTPSDRTLPLDTCASATFAHNVMRWSLIDFLLHVRTSWSTINNNFNNNTGNNNSNNNKNNNNNDINHITVVYILMNL